MKFPLTKKCLELLDGFTSHTAFALSDCVAVKLSRGSENETHQAKLLYQDSLLQTK